MTPAPIPEELAKALEHARDESKPTLERMTAASAARDMLDGWLQQIAWQAREEGHSWAQVGSKLGTTKQAAQQRFGRRIVVERHRSRGGNVEDIVAKVLRKRGLQDIEEEFELEGQDVHVTEEEHDGKRVVRVRVRKQPEDD